MAVEFNHNGRIWRADTAEEAIALRRKLEAEDRAIRESGHEPTVIRENVWTPDVTLEFFNNTGELQKQFLQLLGSKPQLTSAEAIEALPLDSEVSLAGVLSGLSKQLKKVGLKPYELYSTSIAWLGKGKKERTFRMAWGFKYAIEELGGFGILMGKEKDAPATKSKRK